MAKKLPTVGYEHIGAHARGNDAYAGMSPQEGLIAYVRDHQPLGLQERRDFLRGWRRNMVMEPVNKLIAMLDYMTAPQLEALGGELAELAKAYDAKLR